MYSNGSPQIWIQPVSVSSNWKKTTFCVSVCFEYMSGVPFISLGEKMAATLSLVRFKPF